MNTTILDKYKAVFIKELESCCTLYKLIGGGPNESPMWIQYRGMRERADNTTIMEFKNSQKNAIGFIIKVKDEDLDALRADCDIHVQSIYQYFRELKYNYIQKNHPRTFKELERMKITTDRYLGL